MTMPETRPGQITYRDAGVDLEAKAEAYRRIGDLVRSTYTPGVLSDIGTFGGLFALEGYRDPVLVSSVDSVGTKLKVAFAVDRHDTVGYDIVAHCGNDVVVQGARPLFFLDYIGIHDLNPTVVRDLLDGLARGCRELGCALIGGEAAELPDLYAPGEYDLVGTIVGVVERDSVVTGDRIEAGDVLIGLPSVGLHTNGFTLARKVLFEVAGLSVSDAMPGTEVTVGEEFLKPHKSYVGACIELMRAVDVRGFAHITGGGLPENVRRILPDGTRAHIQRDCWSVPAVFRLLQQAGAIDDGEMFRVFNMGVGMVAVVPPDDCEAALTSLRSAGESPTVIGEVSAGEAGVEIA